MDLDHQATHRRYDNVQNTSVAQHEKWEPKVLSDKLSLGNINEFQSDINTFKDPYEDSYYSYREGIEWTKATLLGSGAYSNCYQARDVLTGTIMAVKQISNLNDVSYLSQINEAGSFNMADSIGIFICLSERNN